MAQVGLVNGEAGALIRAAINDNFAELYNGASALAIAVAAALPATSLGLMNVALATDTVGLITNRVLYMPSWPGLTVGTGLTQVQQAANAIAMQAASDYANSHALFIDLGAAQYEIYGGLIDAAGVYLGVQFKSGVRGIDGNGQAVITQFHPQHPAVTLGMTDGTPTYAARYQDFAVAYKATPVVIQGTISGSVLTVTSVTGGAITAGCALWSSAVATGGASISAFGTGSTTGTGGTGTYQLQFAVTGATSSTSFTLMVPTSRGLLIGNHSNGKFTRVTVQGGYASIPYYGISFAGTYGFFSNVLEGVRSQAGGMALASLAIASGTGNVWNNTYFGGGGQPGAGGKPGQYCMTAGLLIVNAGTKNVFNQLNVEWISAPHMMQVQNTPNLVFNSVHLEGNQPISGSHIYGYGATRTVFNGVHILNPDISSSRRLGTGTSFFRLAGGAAIDVTSLTISNTVTSGYGSIDTSIPLAAIASPQPGSQEMLTMRLGYFGGAFYTSTGLDLDASLPRATYGIVTSFKEYNLHKVRSSTLGAYINAGTGTVNVYGAHRNPTVGISAALTADQTVQVVNAMSASGVGSTCPRSPQDLINVVRTASATGAFNVNVVALDGVTPVAQLTAANTDTTVVFNGTNVAAA